MQLDDGTILFPSGAKSTVEGKLLLPTGYVSDSKWKLPRTACRIGDAGLEPTPEAVVPPASSKSMDGRVKVDYYYFALYEFNDEYSEYLNVIPHDKVRVLNKNTTDAGWWMASLEVTTFACYSFSFLIGRTHRSLITGWFRGINS
jgi:hypothetical protein